MGEVIMKKIGLLTMQEREINLEEIKNQKLKCILSKCDEFKFTETMKNIIENLYINKNADVLQDIENKLNFYLMYMNRTFKIKEVKDSLLITMSKHRELNYISEDLILLILYKYLNILHQKQKNRINNDIDNISKQREDFLKDRAIYSPKDRVIMMKRIIEKEDSILNDMKEWENLLYELNDNLGVCIKDYEL